MRRLLLLAASCVWLVACGSDGNGDDGGADLSPAPDLGGCVTSCDCPAGQTCGGGSCYAGVIAVYCCSDENCPSGAVCQSPNGEVSTCGGAARSP